MNYYINKPLEKQSFSRNPILLVCLKEGFKNKSYFFLTLYNSNGYTVGLNFLTGFTGWVFKQDSAGKTKHHL